MFHSSDSHSFPNFNQTHHAYYFDSDDELLLYADERCERYFNRIDNKRAFRFRQIPAHYRQWVFIADGVCEDLPSVCLSVCDMQINRPAPNWSLNCIRALVWSRLPEIVRNLFEYLITNLFLFICKLKLTNDVWLVYEKSWRCTLFFVF